MLLALLGLFGMFAASAMLLWDRNETATKMASLGQLGELASVISDVVHELQRERGISTGYIASFGHNFTEELNLQRKETDRTRIALRSALNDIPLTEFGSEMVFNVQLTNDALDQLDKARKGVNELKLSVNQMAGYYTATIAKSLAIVEQMTSLSLNAEVTRAISAYTDFLRGKDHAGLERAIGTQGFSRNAFSPPVYVRFVQLIAVQKALFDNFQRNATQSQAALYRKSVGGPVAAEVERMREIAIVGGANGRRVAVDPRHWWGEMTKKINILKSIEDRIAADLLTLTSRVQESARTDFVVLAFIVVLLAVCIAALAFVIGRGITRPVRNMTEVMAKLAAGDLGVNVEALTQGDEIGEMARAVEVFKENAIDKARLEKEERRTAAEREERIQAERRRELKEIADREARYRQVREAEKAKMESERKFRRLVEGSIQGIIINDDQGIVFANDSMARIFGYEDTLEFLATENSLDLVHPEDRERVALNHNDRMAGKPQNARHRFRCLRKDGETIWLESIDERVEWDGRPVVQSTVFDITELKRAEEGVRRSQKMDAIGHLAGGLAHDFNNLLGIVSGNLELLRRKSNLDERAAKKVAVALKATSRGAALTRQLLDFTRREAAGTSTVDINEVIRGVSPLIEQSVSKLVEINYDLAEGIAHTNIDPGDFEDVLVNLSQNSKDAMPAGGTFTIETSQVVLDSQFANAGVEDIAGEFVLVSVSDTGHGIVRDQLDQIFEPFFTTKGKGKGTGLGLAMVYGFVKRSGGHIRVYSEPDVGTTFRIYLPVSTSIAVSQDGASPAEEKLSERGSETLLIVDDEIEILDITVSYLRDAGYEVISATNGQDALDLIRKRSDIDMVISDVIMPGGLNGFDVAIEAQRLRPTIKAALVSGFTGRAGEVLASSNLLAKYLAANLLSKPFSRDQLLTHVRKHLDEPQHVIWSDDLTVGVRAIDDDHRVLLGLLNRMHAVSHPDETADMISRLLFDLAAYTSDHFRREEVVMEVCGYPDITAHKLAHAKLEQQIANFVKRQNAETDDGLAEDIRQFLDDWLTDHIGRMDKAIEPFTRGKTGDVEKALAGINKKLENA